MEKNKTKKPSEFAELRKIWTFSKRESGTYRISGYKGEEVEDIVIPATINGVKVTELGNNEQIFNGLIASKIKRITIPESIEKINSVAFQICESLEQLSLPEGLETIAYCTFRYCKSLKSIDIPGSVREIGVAAFGSCQSLEQVTLSEGLERIGYGAFQDCKSLKTITIPGSIREIVENAFMGCQSLKRIVFDGAVPKLGRNALGDVEAIYAPKATAKDFAQNKEAYLIGFLQMLKEGKADSELIKINNQNIKQNALKLCETKNEELFTYILQNKLITLKTTDELIAKYNEERNVARVSALIDYKDKNFTEGQKERQFNKQFEIKEPKAPTELAKLKEIWNFTKTEEGTYRITAYKGEDVNVTVPTEIKGISVTEIGSNTFHYQERIKNVTLPDGIKLIRNGTFDGCEALKTITIPASVKEIGNYAFCNCESLEQIILPEGLTNIGYWAFNNCKSLKTITIPSSVKEIGNYAFCNCESLEEINLPEGLMNIGYGAFQDCKSLKTITIPSSVKELLINNNNFGCSDPDSGVFNGCGSLKEVVLSKELEKIEYGTFKDCKALKSIIIPASVKEIGGYVFLDCPDITIYCRIDEQPKDWVWGWNAIDDDGHKAKVVWGYKGE